jgi:hypothetical protein
MIMPDRVWWYMPTLKFRFFNTSQVSESRRMESRQSSRSAPANTCTLWSWMTLKRPRRFANHFLPVSLHFAVSLLSTQVKYNIYVTSMMWSTLIERSDYCRWNLSDSCPKPIKPLCASRLFNKHLLLYVNIFLSILVSDSACSYYVNILYLGTTNNINNFRSRSNGPMLIPWYHSNRLLSLVVADSFTTPNLIIKNINNSSTKNNFNHWTTTINAHCLWLI